MCPSSLGERRALEIGAGHPGGDHIRSWVTCQRFPDLERQGTGSPRPQRSLALPGWFAKCAEGTRVDREFCAVHPIVAPGQDCPDETETAFSMRRAGCDPGSLSVVQTVICDA